MYGRFSSDSSWRQVQSDQIHGPDALRSRAAASESMAPVPLPGPERLLHPLTSRPEKSKRKGTVCYSSATLDLNVTHVAFPQLGR
ncbi:unnamed protein product [Knipowitschia caucasica]